MSENTIKIEPDIISWSIQKVQQENIGSSVFELLRRWQSGEKVPTFKQVERYEPENADSIWLFLPEDSIKREMLNC